VRGDPLDLPESGQSLPFNTDHECRTSIGIFVDVVGIGDKLLLLLLTPRQGSTTVVSYLRGIAGAWDNWHHTYAADHRADMHFSGVCIFIFTKKCTSPTSQPRNKNTTGSTSVGHVLCFIFPMLTVAKTTVSKRFVNPLFVDPIRACLPSSGVLNIPTGRSRSPARTRHESVWIGARSKVDKAAQNFDPSVADEAYRTGESFSLRRHLRLFLVLYSCHGLTRNKE
jgi:hypothetical protein